MTYSTLPHIRREKNIHFILSNFYEIAKIVCLHLQNVSLCPPVRFFNQKVFNENTFAACAACIWMNISGESKLFCFFYAGNLIFFALTIYYERLFAAWIFINGDMEDMFQKFKCLFIYLT